MSLKVPEVSIQHKILVGHLILFAIIACIFGILQHERMRISDIEKKPDTFSRYSARSIRPIVISHFLPCWVKLPFLGRERICRLSFTSAVRGFHIAGYTKENEIHVARSQVDSLRSLLKSRKSTWLKSCIWFKAEMVMAFYNSAKYLIMSFHKR